MLAGFNRTSQRRRIAALLVSLSLACGHAFAQARPDLDQRLDEIRAINRYVPQKGLAMLLAIEPQGRAAGVDTKAEFLNQLCLANRNIGRTQEAMVLAEELIAFGRQQHDDVALAKGLMAKAYVFSSMNDLKASHNFVWEGERIANTTSDMPLKISVTITSGNSYAEDGNFPEALGKL